MAPPTNRSRHWAKPSHRDRNRDRNRRPRRRDAATMAQSEQNRVTLLAWTEPWGMQPQGVRGDPWPNRFQDIRPVQMGQAAGEQEAEVVTAPSGHVLETCPTCGAFAVSRAVHIRTKRHIEALLAAEEAAPKKQEPRKELRTEKP